MRYVIGVDPGPITGIVVLGPEAPVVVQCSWNAFEEVLLGLSPTARLDPVIAVEQFVIGSLTPRANDPGASRAARSVAEFCQQYAYDHALECFMRSAAAVKPWATDARLVAARLFAHTKGMPHARDAARHALFTGVKELGWPDPFSKAARP